MLVSFNTLPDWFRFIDKIKFNYILGILNENKNLDKALLKVNPALSNSLG